MGRVFGMSGGSISENKRPTTIKSSASARKLSRKSYRKVAPDTSVAVERRETESVGGKNDDAGRKQSRSSMSLLLAFFPRIVAQAHDVCGVESFIIEFRIFGKGDGINELIDCCCIYFILSSLASMSF